MDQRRDRATQGGAQYQDLADIQNIVSSMKGDGGAHPPAPQHTKQRPAQPAAAGHQMGAQQPSRAAPRKDIDQHDKEEALRRGTQLLMDQKAALQAKEESLRAKEGELRKVTADLEKQARRVAEQQSQLAKDKRTLAEEEEGRRFVKDRMDTRERELAGREQRIGALESDLKVREQHLLAFEQDIKECPYCNVRFELDGVRDMMDELRGFGIDMSALEGKYQDALGHMKNEAYDSALDSARILLKDIRTVRQDILAKGIRYVVAASSRTVATARQAGQDTTEAERLLAQARAAVDKEQYRAAENLAKEAEYIARDLLRQESSSVQPGAALESEAMQEPPAEQEQAPAEGSGTAPEEGSYPSMYPPPQEPGERYESMYPPQQEEAPPEEQAPLPQPTDRIYNCSSCFAAFKIGSSQRPVRVTCRSCGNSMIISD